MDGVVHRLEASRAEINIAIDSAVNALTADQAQWIAAAPAKREEAPELRRKFSPSEAKTDARRASCVVSPSRAPSSASSSPASGPRRARFSSAVEAEGSEEIFIALLLEELKRVRLAHAEEEEKSRRLEAELKKLRGLNGTLQQRLDEELERSRKQSMIIEAVLPQHLSKSSDPDSGKTRRKARSPPATSPRKKSLREAKREIEVSPPSRPKAAWNDGRDYITAMPNEVLLHIFSFLEPEDLCSCALTCMRLRTLSEHDVIWKPLCSRKWSSRLSSTGWKAQYRHRHMEYNRTAKNWTKGKCRLLTLHGHTSIVHCLQLDENRVVSGAGYGDNTVKIWDLATGTCVQTLEGHTQSVHCLKARENIVVSGSSDIRLWDMERGHCTQTLQEHTDVVLCMQLRGTTLFTGSSDRTVKLWDFRAQDASSTCTLSGHRNWVTCVELVTDPHRIVTASYDNTLRFWDVRNPSSCYDTAVVPPVRKKKEVKGVGSLQYHDETIVTGTGDGRVRIWKQHKGQWMPLRSPTLDGHQGAVWCLSFHGERLISGCADKTLRLWNIENGQTQHTFRGHDGGVYCVAHSQRRIVSGSFDKNILVYDFEC